MNWLRRLDELLFSPPHTFGTVLTLVALRLSLFGDDVDSESGTLPTDQSANKPSDTVESDSGDGAS